MENIPNSVVIYDKWLSQLGGGEVVACSIAQILKKKFQVVILCDEPIHINKIKNKLGIDLSGVKIISIKKSKSNILRLLTGSELFVNLSQGSIMPGLSKKNIYYVHFPSKRKGNLHTYQLILSNSQYTQYWVNKYWQIQTPVLYPPVQLINYDYSTFNKKKWICSVGRFFNNAHNKKHSIMIQAFIKLYSQGYTDWQLHLVGGTGTKTDKRYLTSLIKHAQNFPVFFHIGISRNQLEQLYLDSNIYWQTTGFDEDSIKYPYKFEHCGISAIEAISAGCYPVLYNGGGLKEIISVLHLTKYSLFSTMEELISKSIYQMNRYSNNSFQVNNNNILYEYFSYNTFKKNLLKLIYDEKN